jgi:D-glycero-D-manno-heptose 1,7-bisphosphate phosphatase
MKGQAAVFMDRDGTINEEVGYLDNINKLVIYPQTFAAVRKINELGMISVVITNQSGVARGIFTEDLVAEVHRRIQEALKERGAHIDAFFYCPHHPSEGQAPYRQLCTCRKPEAGMIITAAKEMDIDLQQSYMIGDTLKDMEAGVKAGAKGVLVRTGYGREQEKELASFPIKPAYIADDILEAVDWIIIEHQK